MTDLTPLTVEHKDAIVEIVINCQAQMQSPAALHWPPPLLEQILQQETAYGLIDPTTQKLMSFLIFRDMQFIAEIYVLATHPQFQKRGCMGKLIKYLQDNFNEVWLEVHNLNKSAIHFYLSHGFYQSGLRKRYYKDGADAILLTWRRELAIT